MAAKKGSQFLTYKGRPLVRSGDTIYYGNMYEKFVIVMKIESMRPMKDLELPGRVNVQLMNTDPMVRPRDRVANKAVKQGLWQALELASVWLDRALA